MPNNYPGTRVEKTHHITRNPTCDSWVIRVQRDGKMHQKSIADRDHGGTKRAFAMAVRNRNRLLVKLPNTPEDFAIGNAHRQNWRWLSRTGVKGIGFTMQTCSRTGKRRPIIIVMWEDADGQRQQTSRSVWKYGPKKALMNACETLYVERVAAGKPSPDPGNMFNDAWDSILELLVLECDSRYGLKSNHTRTGELP